MTNRLEKFLAGLNSQERKRVDLAIEKLGFDWKAAGDIKSLSGQKGFFRFRVGRFRIIFEVIDNEAVVRKIGLRDDTFYN